MKSKNVKMSPGEFLPDFFKRQGINNIPIHENTLFVEEEILDKLPSTWPECVMLLVGKNYQGAVLGSNNSYLVDLNEKQTEKAFDLVAGKSLRLYAFSDKFWEIAAYHKPDTDEVYYVGGENLRKFLDRKNLHYSSFMTDDGLISSTSMKHLKNENEDCRKPVDINVN